MTRALNELCGKDPYIRAIEKRALSSSSFKQLDMTATFISRHSCPCEPTRSRGPGDGRLLLCLKREREGWTSRNR